MIIDRMLVMSEDQAVTDSAASTNYLDLGAANLDIGAGTALWWWVIMTAGFGTSANTLTIDLRNDGNTPPTTKVLEGMRATATSALLTPAVLVRIALPGGKYGINGRYVNTYYTASATLNTGTVSSFIVCH